MAADTQSVDISSVAWIGGRWSYHPFLKENKSLGGLESRARGIRSLYCPVIKGMVGVSGKPGIVFAALFAD